MWAIERRMSTCLLSYVISCCELATFCVPMSKIITESAPRSEVTVLIGSMFITSFTK